MIDRFTLVEINGGSDDKATVTPWNPSAYEQPGLQTARKILGVTMTSSEVTEQVAVMMRGYLRSATEQGGETWSVGDILWAKSYGVITNVRPVAPLPLVVVGVVFADEASGGPFTVAVNVQAIPSLGELSGVLAETPADLDVFIYNGASNYWEPRQLDHGADLAGLSDNDDHPQYQQETDFVHPFLFMGGC